MAQDILIIVNCDRNARNRIQMFCDPAIATDNSEGSYELGIRVPADTELRWRAVPLQITDVSGAAGVYHVIIEQYHLWNNEQGDAAKYLVEWGTSNGNGDAPRYTNPGNLDADKITAITVEGINRPFVQCLTQLTSRDENQSPKVAYNFTVAIYKNGTKIEDLSWDPSVIVYRA